ncbi:hypothetical protein SH661x_000194 [Planctomicrobium sp. SH661]|uniref:NHL domain-containing protein n=1 Tax=Planctomicrobium sp. SH661 TaxID=3448124 RepID=UPI003F5BC46B
MSWGILSANAAEVATVLGTGTRGNSTDGTVADAALIGEPFGLVIGPDGALYVCEVGNHLVRRVDLKSGETKVVAGSGEKGYSGDRGPATAARMNEPYEVRFDSRGNMLVVEMQNAVVRRIDAKTQEISTIAGDGRPGFAGDGGPANRAQLDQPHAITLDRDGHIYICDIRNGRVRKVDAENGTISTFLGGGKQPLSPENTGFDDLKLQGPRALDVAGADAFVLALREGNSIYRIDVKNRTLQHLAGTGKSGYSRKSVPGPDAVLAGPKGIVVAPSGDIYFADTESHTVRVIRAATGHVETAVGDGQRGDGPDGDPLQCRLARPHGVCVDAHGNVYIGDSENHRVRVFRPE